MLPEILQIGEPHVDVEIVGAGLQNVEVASRAFGGDHRLKIRVEQRWTKLLQFFDKGLVGRELAECCMAPGLKGRALKLIESEIGQELLRGRIVVVAAIGPEQLGERHDLLARRRRYALRMRRDRVEQALLPQSES